MSTKIYEAYKVPIARLNDFIDFVRPQVFDRAENVVRKLMTTITKETVDKEIKEKPYMKDATVRFRKVLDLITEVAKKRTRTPVVDITYTLNIWLYEDFAYIIPCGEFRWQGFELNTLWAEDFSYWNNTDRPEGISDEEWEHRSITWDKINCGTGTADHNSRRLNHSIIDFGSINGDFNAEFELSRRILENQHDQTAGVIG